MAALDSKITAYVTLKLQTNYRNEKRYMSSFQKGMDEGWMAWNYMVILRGLVHDIGIKPSFSFVMAAQLG